MLPQIKNYKTPQMTKKEKKRIKKKPKSLSEWIHRPLDYCRMRRKYFILDWNTAE
jgi:hypothetical protein